MIITTTNVGSFGADNMEELKPENIIVRQQVFDSLAKINNEIDPVDIFAVQECRAFNFEPIPFFNLPTATSSHVTWGKDEGGTRGTCIYSSAGTEAIDLKDDRHEVCAVKFKYKGENRKIMTAALINVYRNQSKNHTRTIPETRQFLTGCLSMLRRDHGIGKYVICGDFNSSNFYVPGLKEFRHDKMFHQANKNSSKKYIDKVFSNIEDLEIVAILPTCENKHGTEGSEDLGHKTIVIRVGKKAAEENVPIKTLKFSDFKRRVRNHRPCFNPIENDLSCPLEKRSSLERHCLDFTNLMISLANQSMRSKMVSRRQGIKIRLIQNANELDDKVLSVKEASQEIYKLVGAMKTGIDTPTDKKKPELAEFRNHLQDKLKNLNKGDFELAKKVINQAYENVKKVDLKMPSKKVLKQILMATSSSGARDHYGISLKATKIYLGQNKAIMNRFIDLAQACLYEGFFPDCWKQDVISFLFKKKGDYDNPKFWRPITIAVSLGKHLEKITAFFLDQGNDMNHNNHAYTKGKSCLTAVLGVQQKLAQARKLKSMWKDQELILGIGADDIASAFESVDHRIVIYAIQKMFISCEIIRIDRLIESYLHRNSRVTDHDTGELLLVIRAFIYKTIPQGSILSPKLWRIYDLTFSVLYENSLKLLMAKKACVIGGDLAYNPDDAQALADIRIEVNQSLICFAAAITYADDHVTVIAILVRKEIQISVKRELVFKQI